MKVSVMDEHIPLSQKTDDQVIKVGAKQHSSITHREQNYSQSSLYGGVWWQEQDFCQTELRGLEQGQGDWHMRWRARKWDSDSFSYSCNVLIK